MINSFFTVDIIILQYFGYYVHSYFEKLEIIFGFKLEENFGSGESDGDSRKIVVRIVGIVDVGDVGIVRSESGENVVVIVEIEGDSVGHVFSP
jgi:hypothetical protein